MKVILREDVAGVGVIGDMVEVAPGFARNYLIPRRLAVAASLRNVGVLEHHKRMIAKKREKILADANALAEKINKLTIEITASVGAKGKLYGSVTSMNIADEMAKKGLDLDRRKIELAEPIKHIGDYVVPVKLSAGVKAELKLSILPDAPYEEEEEKKEEEAAKEEEKKSKPKSRARTPKKAAEKEGKEKPKKERAPRAKKSKEEEKSE